MAASSMRLPPSSRLKFLTSSPLTARNTPSLRLFHFLSLPFVSPPSGFGGFFENVLETLLVFIVCLRPRLLGNFDRAAAAAKSKHHRHRARCLSRQRSRSRSRLSRQARLPGVLHHCQC